MNYPDKTKEELIKEILDLKEEIQILKSINNDKIKQHLEDGNIRFKTMFEAHGSIMLLIDPLSGEILDANQSASEFYGYPIETLCSMNINQINCLSPEQIKYERKSALEKKRNYFIFPHILASGEKRIVEVHSSPFSYNVKVMLLSIIYDITDRLKSEKIIQENNKNLQELNASKDKFFSIIAHDLRSPFSGFLTLTKLIVEKSDKMSIEEIKKYTQMMKISAFNLYELLENLLTWAHLQRGMINYFPSECILASLVNQNVNVLDEVARQKNIQIISQVTDNLSLFVDSSMINSVFRNLISNAIKFTHKNGKIIILSKQTETEITISIEDSGIGINSDTLNKLFKIDEKVARPGTDGEPSTGLGLILCKEFIEKHNGKIWVESAIGRGSIFYFTLPKNSN